MLQYWIPFWCSLFQKKVEKSKVVFKTNKKHTHKKRKGKKKNQQEKRSLKNCSVIRQNILQWETEIEQSPPKENWAVTPFQHASTFTGDQMLFKSGREKQNIKKGLDIKCRQIQIKYKS